MNSAEETNGPRRERRLIVAEECGRARERYRKFVGVHLHAEISRRERWGGRLAIDGENISGTVYHGNDHRRGIGGLRGCLDERHDIGASDIRRGRGRGHRRQISGQATATRRANELRGHACEEYSGESLRLSSGC